MLAASLRRPRPRPSHSDDRDRPTQHHSSEDDGPADLPPYEPPRYPINADSQCFLRGLATTRFGEKYQKQLEQSAKLLSSSVLTLNERLTYRKRRAAQEAERAAKRKNNGDDAIDSTATQGARDAFLKLQEDVLVRATELEAAMRDVIDMQAALQDDISLLRALPDLVASRQRLVTEEAKRAPDAVRRRAESETEEAKEGEKAGDEEAEEQEGQDEDEEQEGGKEGKEEGKEEDEEPHQLPSTGVSVLRVLQEARDAKAAEYVGLDAYHKYAVHNSYIEFKRSWHEGLFLDEARPVPDPTRWFDQDGRPRHETYEKDRQAGGDESSDSEVQIERETRSFRCPLALTIMKEPYKCRLCNHSYEKSAVMEYIRMQSKGSDAAVKCPVPGCHVESITLEDLDLDESLLRRIKRAEQEEKEREQQGEEEEEDDDDESEEDQRRRGRRTPT